MQDFAIEFQLADAAYTERVTGVSSLSMSRFRRCHSLPLGRRILYVRRILVLQRGLPTLITVS